MLGANQKWLQGFFFKVKNRNQIRVSEKITEAIYLLLDFLIDFVAMTKINGTVILVKITINFLLEI